MATVVSAPGKVLIAGGYLVLDHRYPGLVVSTSSRFYTVVQPASRSGKIIVNSPQFENAIWAYDVKLEGDGIRIEQVEDATGSKNRFVQTALEGTLAIALAIEEKIHSLRWTKDWTYTSLRPMIFTLNAQALPPTLDSLNSIPPFLPQGCPIGQVHKTGLGSSASLITSLVSALLLHFDAISPDSLSSDALRMKDENSRTMWPTSCKESQMDRPCFPPLPLEQSMEPHRLSLQTPPLTRIMLADVDSGSDTPSMVGNVLKWKKAEPAVGTFSDQLWEGLDKCNRGLGDIVNRLSQRYDEDPNRIREHSRQTDPSKSIKWERQSPIEALEVTVAQLFGNTRQLAKSIRDGMRAMGKSSGVPIEPPEQTRLLDACCALPGVIGGGVPGAGGYDAIWLLVLQPQDKELASSVVASVEKLWQRWTELSVSPLLATESLERGARKELLQDVLGLEAALKGSA
ncbi:phosphomevalonate kinase-like protein [Rhizoctonia solani]|uniref:Phosphomevalonate kinase n=1 Tax=Rhizoctonia solani TaxID=456999 RepID=A0A8H8SWV8_9AGAM|nr:phosphomevalonate kinase-like protein [Rhizoctonia solani]QRW21431.1 phosphomevalonate kinase-like protein [Rhizoctonia solani]